MSRDDALLLAGDIGGTKTALAIFSVEKGPRKPLVEATFPSGDYASLEEMVRTFLAERGDPVEHAVFGIAGLVTQDQAQVTNLSWKVNARTLSQALGGVPVRLLNDLEAIAYSVPLLESLDLETLNPGQPVAQGVLAVIAPGTGLGEAFLIWDGKRYRPFPSEGGHVDFAPSTLTELDLLGYLQSRYDHVSYERVCSGIGLPNLYAFLRDSARVAEPDWLRQQLAEATDPTPIVVQAALENQAEICAATLDLFISILGCEAGNLALKVLATGGMYLGGGIPPRILPRLRGRTFMRSFTRKGRFSDLLARIPVHVILNPELALFGAACHGLEAMRG